MKKVKLLIYLDSHDICAVFLNKENYCSENPASVNLKFVCNRVKLLSFHLWAVWQSHTQKCSFYTRNIRKPRSQGRKLRNSVAKTLVQSNGG